MNVKDRIYQIVSDKNLSVDEKYDKIQELLHGKGDGPGNSSNGTGEGSGGNSTDISGSEGNQETDNANQEAENKAQQAADQAQQAADQAQQAADQAAEQAQKSGSASDKDIADQAQQAADQAQQSADEAQNSLDNGGEIGSSDANQAQKAANQAQKAANQAQKAANQAQQAANKSKQSDSGKDSSGQQGSGQSQAQDAANKAQQAANQAQQAADEAQETADKVQNAANQAQNAADQAAEQAQKSGSTSDKESAEQAQDIADKTQDIANQAQKAANQAQDIANRAQQAANQAQDAADNNDNQSAQQAANKAQQAANQAQQTQNQKQDPEEWLKDLDLGEKQRYKKAKGDGTDDPIVNGLPPGEIEDDDDDDQQGGFGGQMPKEFDDYTAGKYIGIAYAKEVFKGRGVKPTYAYQFDIPDVEDMRLIESMLAESNVDIKGILSRSGDERSKAEEIYKLLFPDADDVNTPEELIMMRNGDASIEDWADDDHVITKELGDEIKKEIEEMPNSVDQDIKEIEPDWGSTGSDGEIQEKIKYIQKLLDPNYIQDKWKREAAKKFLEKFGVRIEKNSEGIIDWKRSLEDFLFDVSSHRENGRIKKNLYTFSGIGARHKKRVYESIGKVVIYADTSGSAYEFCSSMIAEVSKMANDCDIHEFDIHLFTDVVYAEHFGIDGDTISSDEFGFEDVQSGGTSLNNVYNHIIENYFDGYELDDDVSAIIIMTDVDGVKESGKIDNSKYFENAIDQMLYLLFDPGETTQRALQKLLPKMARYIAITPSMFGNNIQESYIYKTGKSVLHKLYNNENSIDNDMYINEAISRNINAVKKTLNKKDELSTDEKNKIMRVHNIRAMRDLDRIDQLVPEIFAAMESTFPEVKVVKNVDYFQDTENTFYIDDDLRLWIHKNFVSNSDAKLLIELCKKINVFMIVGDVFIQNLGIIHFPQGFPKEIKGFFKLNNLKNLKDFTNAPNVIYGYSDDKSPIINPASQFMRRKPYMVDEYINSITDKNKQKQAITNFNILLKKDNDNDMNESARNLEIKHRFEIGQKYLYEAFGGKLNDLFRAYKPQEPKYDEPLVEPNVDDYPDTVEGKEKYDKDLEIYYKRVEKRNKAKEDYANALKKYNDKLPVLRKNKEAFQQIFNVINAEWSSIDGSDITFEDDYNKMLYEHKRNLSKFSGIKIFTDEYNQISLVYGKMKNNNGAEIIYYQDYNGNAVTDKDKINAEILKRHKIYKKADEMFTGLGFKWDDLPRKKKGVEPDIKETLNGILYECLAKYCGFETSRKQFDIKKVIYVPDPSYTDEQNFEYIMDEIFDNNWGDDRRSRGPGASGYAINFGNSKYTYLDFDSTKDNASELRQDFNNAVNAYNPDFNPAVFFTDDILKFIIITSSIRNERTINTTKYSIDEVENFSRQELIDAVNDVLSLSLYKSPFKYMTYNQKDNEKNGSVTPTGVLLLFPDFCQKEYTIDVNIDSFIEKNVENHLGRESDKARISATIKNYEYDPKTGQRIRKDIGGYKKSDLNVSNYDAFVNLVDQYKNINYGSINNIIDSAVKSTKNRSEYKDLIDRIKGITGNFLAYNDNNYEGYFETLIDYYTDVYQGFANILTLDPKQNSIEIVKELDNISSIYEEIKKIYLLMSGRKDKLRDKFISKRQRQLDKIKNANLNAHQSNSEKTEKDINDFKSSVDYIRDNYDSVREKINDNVPRISDYLPQLTNFISSVIRYGDSLINDKSENRIAEIKPSYDEIVECFENVINSDDELELLFNSSDILRKSIFISKKSQEYANPVSARTGLTA